MIARRRRPQKPKQPDALQPALFAPAPDALLSRLQWDVQSQPDNAPAPPWTPAAAAPAPDRAVRPAMRLRTPVERPSAPSVAGIAFSLVSGHPCGKCGAADCGRRVIQWRGVRQSVCPACGNNGQRRSSFGAAGIPPDAPPNRRRQF